MKKFLRLSALVLALLPAFGLKAFADSKSRMDVVIAREKQDRAFTSVSNVWVADDAFDSKLATSELNNWQALNLNKSTLSKIVEEKLPAITLLVPGLNGNNYQLELIRYEFFSADFKVRTIENGTPVDFGYTPGVYYRGIVKGHEGSIATVSFFDDEVYAMYSMPDVTGNFVIAPNTLLAQKDNSRYLLYNDVDIKKPQMSAGCATDKLPKLSNTQLGSQKNVYSTCKDVEQYLLIDYNTYISKGGNAAAVTSLTNYITAVYNMLATLYRNEGIYTSIKKVDVNTTLDAYNGLPDNSRDWLEAFGQEIQNNLQGADLAMLITMKSAGMGGIAWLGVLCGSYDANWHSGPYAFSNIGGNFTGSTLPTYHWDIEVMTHEMGHNLGSPHTHGCDWNGNSTAIDGCAPTYDINYAEGSCPIGPVPSGAVGGSIMSYCHLLSGVGIKFANGFGPQPGQLIRDNVTNSTCATEYLPKSPINMKDTVVVANRECTDDLTGITYYWKDNNNMNKADDKLVMMIKKNGNDIAGLDSATSMFDVRVITGKKFGTNKGDTVAMPSGIPGMEAYYVASSRYWKITAEQPTTNVEVMFPITKADLKDIDGSVSGNPLTNANLSMYMMKTNINPAPDGGLPGATAADVKFYTNGSVVSGTKWVAETTVDTTIAHALTTNLYGGAMVYGYTHPVSVNEINAAPGNINFYPNPTADAWTVWMPANAGKAVATLYSADGRIVAKQQLNAGELNQVSAATLTTGVYYYRVATDMGTYTGTLKKH